MQTVTKFQQRLDSIKAMKLSIALLTSVVLTLGNSLFSQAADIERDRTVTYKAVEGVELIRRL